MCVSARHAYIFLVQGITEMVADWFYPTHLPFIRGFRCSSPVYHTTLLDFSSISCHSHGVGPVHGHVPNRSAWFCNITTVSILIDGWISSNSDKQPVQMLVLIANI